MSRSSVDLPQPLGPEQKEQFAGRDIQIDFVQNSRPGIIALDYLFQ